MTERPTPAPTPELTATTDADRRRFADRVAARLAAAGHRALLAGGCVRDLLLGQVPKDYDIATAARPEQVRRLFPRTLAIGAAFGVVQVQGPGGVSVEVATFRADREYSDGRRPDSVAYADDPETDAARRDFTINGMFLDPATGAVLDFVGGREDLAGRRLRAIGDPEARFGEDRLRMLRAVRFAARLGFALDEAAAEAVRRHAAALTVVSAERILGELRRMLPPPTRGEAARLLAETGLAPVVFPMVPAAAWPAGAAALSRLGPAEATLPLALACLLTDVPGGDGGLAERLRLTNAEADRLTWLLAHRNGLADARRAKPHRLKRLLAHAGREELFRLADATGRDHHTAAVLLASWGPAIDPPPLLTGEDLKAAGRQPGPAFKRLLEAVRDRQLDGELADRAAALAWLADQPA